MNPQLLSQLCEALEARGLTARLDGEDRTVHAVNTLQDAGRGELSFLSNPKYAPLLSDTAAEAVIVGEDVERPERMSVIRSNDPYAAVTYAVVIVHGYRRHPAWGIHPDAHVHPDASVGAGANLAPGSFVDAGAVLGDNCTLYPGTFVGARAQLGADCVLYANAVVYDDCVLGDRCTIHAATVVGQDGLGYAPVDGRWVKIPQVGIVEIAEDVEIGANCSIDRATLGKTVIGAGTKMGNGNVIGHGTRVGRDGMFAGQVGLAGSTSVGDRVTFAGQSGSVGHIEIGDGVTIAAQSMTTEDTAPETRVLGSPAQPIRAELRSVAAYKRLPDLLRTVSSLRGQMERLQGEVDELRAELERRDAPL